MRKERLDKLLVDRGLVANRTKARGLIMAGEVRVDGQVMDKPGHMISLAAVLEVAEPLPYVSRGGYKLAGALAQFGVDVRGRVCADVGACTGGFTDVLLQNGAAQVYAIDVGYGQLDWKIRQDSRVTIMERTNARYVESLPQPVSFVCVDVSFISLKLILPAVQKWLAPQADLITLIKPQFEAGPKQVGKGGIVKDPEVHRQVLLDILSWATSHGFTLAGLTRSSLAGADGNMEFLAWLQQGAEGVGMEVAAAVETVLPYEP
ncbi:MAG: TlyA family RNA methyltransferase [Anaerolineae bacterium]|nr:TlyA family RNA methyltransferase [Anaerolineae bacterium]